MKQLILASSSSARKVILEAIGADFVVEPSSYEEDMTLDLDPPALAIFLSKGKATDVAKKHKNAVILGVDSFAVLDGELFGKPHSLAEAKKTLSKLSGKCHSFLSGFTIIDSDSWKEYSDVVETKVYFRKLTDQEINDYLSKENVMNNAGSYIIQKLGGVLVDKIEGDYFNVSGLPISKIVVALNKFGIKLL